MERGRARWRLRVLTVEGFEKGDARGQFIPMTILIKLCVVENDSIVKKVQKAEETWYFVRL